MPENIISIFLIYYFILIYLKDVSYFICRYFLQFFYFKHIHWLSYFTYRIYLYFKLSYYFYDFFLVTNINKNNIKINLYFYYLIIEFRI